MKCSICKKEGHNKRTCKKEKKTTQSENKTNEQENKTAIANDVTVQPENNSAQPKLEVVKPQLRTEDTGIIFEMAICLALGILYDGKYKYSMESAKTLAQRLSKKKALFQVDRFTGTKGARHDFSNSTDDTKHLSAKTTKKGVGKVAPQVIGQSQPTKFCEIIGIKFTTISSLKEYIQTKIIKILPILVNYTFDCPNVFYNQEKNTIRYITLNTPIEWEKYQFRWTCNWSEWNNSSTLKILTQDNSEIALVEFQFHTKSRTNMAIRWCYENFLTIFKEHLNIIDI